jgi:hypothetical protein
MYISYEIEVNYKLSMTRINYFLTRFAANTGGLEKTWIRIIFFFQLGNQALPMTRRRCSHREGKREGSGVPNNSELLSKEFYGNTY